MSCHIIDSLKLKRWLIYYLNINFILEHSSLEKLSDNLFSSVMLPRYLCSIFVFHCERELYIYFLHVFVFLEYGSSPTVPSTTVSGGKWKTNIDAVVRPVLNDS